MGKLNIIGTAERKIQCNAMHIYLTFSAGGITSAKASETVMQNCDSFLTMLKEKQIDISHIFLENLHTERSYSKKEEYRSERKIRLDFAFDMSLLNQFDFWIQNAQSDILLHTEFYISNLAEIRKELLKEAVEDSRKKAEMLADTMNQKITGFEEVIMDRNFRENTLIDAVPAFACARDEFRGKSVSNELKAPEQTESERIEVVWNIA